MANPFVIAAALARTFAITCPHCGFKKLVARRPAHHRTCPRCKRQFPDPLTHRQTKKK